MMSQQELLKTHLELISFLKTSVLANDPDAIELLDLIIKHNPSGFLKWVESKSTLDLKEAVWRFRNFSMYRSRRDPLPFDNDRMALDSAMTKV